VRTASVLVVVSAVSFSAYPDKLNKMTALPDQFTTSSCLGQSRSGTIKHMVKCFRPRWHTLNKRRSIVATMDRQQETTARGLNLQECIAVATTQTTIGQVQPTSG
jgi:hypothetical protein